jgi:integrase
VPLADGPGETLELLAEHMAQFPPAEVEVTDRTGSRPVKRSARLLFSVDGRPVERDGFNDAWNAAVVRARAAGVDLPARVTPHALRHTYVALMIAAGAHPKAIQSLVGHKNISETLDTYGHLFPEHHESTRAAIGAALRRDKPAGLRSMQS